ncbi:hypothetical protein [Negadavirga shengliensis]|uniref:Uncharacterized protein n=1 Tax=Negadavirga shengliensis TaxID=1389218 RepID=A0ABV9SW69_9BACT
MKIPILFIYFLIFSVSISCKSAKIHDGVEDFQGACYAFLEDLDASRPDPFDEEDFDEELLDFFSEKSLVIANALNLKQELRKHIEMEGKETDRVERFISHQEILNKINLAALEISSLNAAIRCEEDKTEQLAWYLDRLESTKSNRRTVSGIIVDASANLVSGAIILWIADGNTFRQLLGVGASLTQIILNVNNKFQNHFIVLEHETNLIREVFDEDREWSEIMPPAVWYYINEKKVEVVGRTIRGTLVHNWEEFNIRQNQELYLSDGGEYGVNQLRNRASMLDQFASYIDLMKQDLLMFRREVAKLK